MNRRYRRIQRKTSLHKWQKTNRKQERHVHMHQSPGNNSKNQRKDFVRVIVNRLWNVITDCPLYDTEGFSVCVCVFTNLAAMMIARADHCACKAMDQYYVQLHNNTFVLCVVHVPTNKKGALDLFCGKQKLWTVTSPTFSPKHVVISSHTDSFGFIFPGF